MEDHLQGHYSGRGHAVHSSICGAIVVIKYGGAAMVDESIKRRSWRISLS